MNNHAVMSSLNSYRAAIRTMTTLTKFETSFKIRRRLSPRDMLLNQPSQNNEMATYFLKSAMCLEPSILIKKFTSKFGPGGLGSCGPYYKTFMFDKDS